MKTALAALAALFTLFGSFALADTSVTWRAAQCEAGRTAFCDCGAAQPVYGKAGNVLYLTTPKGCWQPAGAWHGEGRKPDALENEPDPGCEPGDGKAV